MSPFSPKIVEKKWGYEIWVANNEKEDYCSKILYIKKGKSTSMHYHEIKHETLYVLDGTLMIDCMARRDWSQWVDRHTQNHKASILTKEGKSIEVSRGKAHKLIAHKGSVTIIEASTFHRDSDSYRLFK